MAYLLYFPIFRIELLSIRIKHLETFNRKTYAVVLFTPIHNPTNIKIDTKWCEIEKNGWIGFWKMLTVADYKSILKTAAGSHSQNDFTIKKISEFFDWKHQSNHFLKISWCLLLRSILERNKKLMSHKVKGDSMATLPLRLKADENMKSTTYMNHDTIWVHTERKILP